MNSKLRMTPINTNQLFRALAILFVVANHSVWFSIAGGMNFLLLLSGYNFASFSFAKNNKQIIIDLWQLIRKITLPSMLVMLFYFIINERFTFEEFFMISNWFYLNKTTNIALPIWYPQMFLQLGVILTVLFLIFPIHTSIKKNNIIATIILVFLSLIVFAIATSIFNTSHLGNRLPHLLLWNFILGWSLWALLNIRTAKNKIIASSLVFISVYIVYGGSHYQGNRLEIFLMLALSFIWLENIHLPNVFVKIINIISSSTLYIFLLHLTFFQVYYLIFPEYTLNYKVEVVTKFAFSVTSCVLVWLIVTAGSNAIKRLNAHQAT